MAIPVASAAKQECLHLPLLHARFGASRRMLDPPAFVQFGARDVPFAFPSAFFAARSASAFFFLFVASFDARFASACCFSRTRATSSLRLKDFGSELLPTIIPSFLALIGHRRVRARRRRRRAREWRACNKKVFRGVSPFFLTFESKMTCQYEKA